MRFSISLSLLVTIASTCLSTSCNSLGDPLHPQTTSLYNVTDGITQANVQYARVRNVVGDNSLITTMVSFSVPSAWKGKQCTLALKTDTCTAPKEIDIFTILPPGYELPPETTSYENRRDQFVGRFVVRGHRIAYWELTSNRGPEFPCPNGDAVGYELVGVDNMGELTWRVDSAYGPMIVPCSQ